MDPNLASWITAGLAGVAVLAVFVDVWLRRRERRRTRPGEETT